MRVLLWWWRQPDHYDWFSAYMRGRGMVPVTRLTVAFTALALGLISFALLFSTVAPTDPVRIGLTLYGVAVGVGSGLMWMFVFPTRAQSVVFAVAATSAIGAVVLAQRNPLVAIIAATSLVCIGGYVALFHTAAIMALNLVTVLVVPAIAATELAATSGVVLAVCAYGVVVVVNLFVPIGIQILIHTLGVDLVRAARDPLTGLLNRRAFYERIRRQLDQQSADTHLVVAMVDLDRFKLLNDTHGHTVGDRALVAVAAALRGRVDDSAVVARIGGEEFLVADFTCDPPPGTLPARLCTAIAHVPHSVTASIGTASSRCSDIRVQQDPVAALRDLVDAADHAMYEAKRNGGNQARHRRDPFDERAPLEESAPRSTAGVASRGRG